MKPEAMNTAPDAVEALIDAHTKALGLKPVADVGQVWFTRGEVVSIARTALSAAEAKGHAEGHVEGVLEGMERAEAKCLACFEEAGWHHYYKEAGRACAASIRTDAAALKLKEQK